MGIFNRIGRLARSEVSELKRVLREGREARDLSPADAAARDELERERLIAEAEAELARSEGDLLGEEIDRFGSPSGSIDAGAEAWGTPTRESIDEIERGADIWARGGEPAPEIL